ncbi:MAG: c-type cytochrome [Bryobacteraceae bacterium]
MKRIRVSILLLGLAAISVAAASRSVWDGVYSKSQVARGQTAYGELCATCHGPSLNGGEASPALSGEDFLGRWRGRTVNDLFEDIRTTMPSDDPGHLSRRQCADITAYILSVNAFPGGDKDLSSTTADLSDIRIEAKH